MTLSIIGNKLKVQKKYLAFFTLIPLLAATAIIKVPCPVCEGSGVISSTGMSGVIVTSVQSAEQGTFLVGCDAYRAYQYDVVLMLQNEGEQDAGGWVALILINTETGQPLDTRYTVVEVKQGTSLTSEFTMSFLVSVMLEKPE